LPPEINSALIFSGAGSAPMLAAAAAWDGLASELESAANSFSSVTSGLAAQAWQGSASAAMLAAAAPYAGWLSTAATQASGAAAQANAVASQFESTLAATVHPAVVAANRSDLVSLVTSNLFGQNATAIAETESQYEQMWAADVAAMVSYHGGASAAAAQLASPAQALQNLPSTAANAAASLGYGNIGNDNLGFFNNGIYNLGIGNTGTFNLGINNTGFANLGIGNFNPNTTINSTNIANPNTPSLISTNTLGNVGIFNYGNANLGIGNTGIGNEGLQVALYTSLLGVGNTGNYNQGFFNFGSSNIGIGNTGTGNIGIGVTGTGNIGIGVTGNNLIGIGSLSVSY